MPISLKELKKTPEELLTSTSFTIRYYVQKFLVNNKGMCYTAAEVFAEVRNSRLRYGKVGKGGVSNALSSLAREKKIEKKGIYYYYDGDENDETR